MIEYVSRSDALHAFCDWCSVCPEEKRDPENCDDILFSVLKGLPAADVIPAPPPHGRLIDADALLRMEQEQYEATIADNPNPWHRTLSETFHITFRKTIENAPTVVPEVMK